MHGLSIKLLFLAWNLCHGFSPISPLTVEKQSITTKSISSSTTILSLSSSSDSNSGSGGAPRRSRLEGNTREPTAEELAIMDEMIHKLANAKVFELPNAVRRAFRIVSSPRFFMRIAELADQAEGDEKEKLSSLASNLVATLEAVVETTEEQLDERAQEVESVVKAAAEPDSGEFLVPLTPERLASMRRALKEVEESSLDEGFLSTVDSWMNKSHLDGMDLMVQILQTLLQMYAGTQIYRARAKQETSDKPEAKLFDKLLRTDTENWEAEIRKAMDEVPPESLKAEVQRTMENVVLGLESGSMTQQVQAEYLRELVSRIETIQQTN